jgi:hypothetical protein
MRSFRNLEGGGGKMYRIRNKNLKEAEVQKTLRRNYFLEFTM